MFKKRAFLPLFITNYLGVLNDNFLKTLACFICIAWVGAEHESRIVTIASAALVIPYLLFSPLAGRFAMIFRKRKVVVWAKFAELFIILFACLGFLFHSTAMVLMSILLMGTQSALFSPSKYGLIRDVGGEEGISYGSGAMEMFAFTGILTGTLMASFLSESVTIPVICGLLLCIAVLGWLSSLTIRAEESEPLERGGDTLNPVRFVKEMHVRAVAFRGLSRIILGLAVFWMIGAIVQMTLIVYCRGELKMSDLQTGMVMSLAAIGIGAGCYLAGLLSGDRVKLRWVPLGGAATGIIFLLLFFTRATGLLFALFIFLATCCSGFYKVPLDSWIQANVKGRELGDMLAYSNLITFLFMLFASAFFWLIETFLFTRFVFLFLGVLILITTYLLANLQKRT